MRREEQVTVQDPVKEQQPDGMSHRGQIHSTRLHWNGKSTRSRRSGDHCAQDSVCRWFRCNRRWLPYTCRTIVRLTTELATGQSDFF